MMAFAVRVIAITFSLFALALMPGAQGSPSTAVGASSAPSKEHKRILILYPLNNNVPTFHQIVAGIDTVIASNNLRAADFAHEYLDILSIKTPAQRMILRELLQQKYSDKSFDLIVSYGNLPLDFLFEEGQDLFPGTPCVVFFGDSTKYPSSKARTIIHVPLKLDSAGTLERGLELFPNTHNVLFIAGKTATNLRFESQARKAFEPWQGKLKFEYIENRSVEELLKYSAQLPPNTLIIYSDVSSDSTGKSFVPRDVVKALAAASNAPVFSMFSTQIDTGVVGGSMIDMERVGAMIGKLMVALEAGKPLDDALSGDHLKQMFNWRQIERWKVNPDRLPANSVFINRPLTLWGQYKASVSSAIVVILILSAMSIVLIIQNRRRRQAEISARESAVQLAAERDILERRVVERTAHLSQALEFNETILLNSPVPMSIHSEDGRCVMANEALARFVGTTREVLLAQNFNKISSWQVTGLHRDCLAALESNSPQKGEAHTVTTFGKKVWFEYRILPRHLKDQKHLLIQFVDLTERKRMEDELRHLAFHDSLTKLPNRRLLLDRMSQALRLGKRDNSYLAVLYVDLNNFKQLNDNFGHDTGDQMLIEVAKRLLAVVRDSDTVARLGGDEFVVLLSGLGPDADQASLFAESVAEKIRRNLSEEYVIGSAHHHSTASLGLSVILGGEKDPEQILDEADLAMYESKRGR